MILWYSLNSKRQKEIELFYLKEYGKEFQPPGKPKITTVEGKLEDIEELEHIMQQAPRWDNAPM